MVMVTIYFRPDLFLIHSLNKELVYSLVPIPTTIRVGLTLYCLPTISFFPRLTSEQICDILLQHDISTVTTLTDTEQSTTKLKRLREIHPTVLKIRSPQNTEVTWSLSTLSFVTISSLVKWFTYTFSVIIRTPSTCISTQEANESKGSKGSLSLLEQQGSTLSQHILLHKEFVVPGSYVRLMK